MTHSRKSSPTCNVSGGVVSPRAHAARKMDIDGFCTRSTSLMSMGERYSEIPRSLRTSAVGRSPELISRPTAHTTHLFAHHNLNEDPSARPSHEVYGLLHTSNLLSRMADREKDARVSSVSSNRSYPSRELNRFMRLGTIVPRCVSTTRGSAPAPTAVRDITSLHHPVAPAPYDGFSA
jgi:hypothetical protein